MATLLTLRRRIKSAQNVAKATRAMQMIAASNLRKAQQATFASRPYVEKLTHLTKNLAGKVEDKSLHPYLTAPGESMKTLVIILSPDKGLCGGLIANLLREFLLYSKDNTDSSYIVMGKKLENQVVKRKNEVLASFVLGTTVPGFGAVYPIRKLINDEYLSGNVSRVKVLYTDFTNIFSQTPKVVDLLPITLDTSTEAEMSNKEEPAQNKEIESVTLYEPSVHDLLPSLLTHYLEMSLHQYLLESFLSEQAARMISMQNATNNARDIIEGFKLEYNKTRQANITGELLDIMGTKKQEA
jgi:F-type H+-transporting ATPase subunit gamma